MKKLKSLSIYLIFCLLGFIVFAIPLGSGDELWNYNFARNLSQGLLPYRDYSIIQTPLSSVFPALLMLFLGRGMIVFRIAEYMLYVLTICVFFHLCTYTCKNKILAVVITIFMLCLYTINFIYSYNHVTILIVLCICDLELSQRKHSDLIIGILAGVSILVKQNTGLFIMLVNVIVSFMYMRHAAEHKREYWQRIIVSFIPGIFFFIFLVLTGILNDFWEYAVLGVGTFKHRFSPLDLFRESWVMGCIFVLLMMGCTRMLWLLIRKKSDRQGVALFLFSLAMDTVMFPLCDGSHVLLAVFVLLPVYFYFVQVHMTKNEGTICLAVAVIVAYLFVDTTIEDVKNMHFYDLHNYEYMPMYKDYYLWINEIDNCILKWQEAGYQVRIADSSAVLFYIPLDQYEKNWHMLLVGNLGMSSMEDLLAADKECIYLLRKNYEGLCMQNHYDLIHYIKENYEVIGEVVGFDIYREKQQ